MMRTAGEMGTDFPLKAIVAINNPFDIWLGIQLMRGSIYEKHLAKELRQNLVIRDPKFQTEREKEIFQEMVKKFKLDVEKLSKVETWREFDEEFTIKIHPQFPNAAAYYHASSCLD